MRLQRIHLEKNPHRQRGRGRWTVLFVGLAALAFAPIVGEGLLQNTDPRLLSEQIRFSGGKPMNVLTAQQAPQQNAEGGNAARKKQIAEDSAKLFMLATELKAEVDKTNKDTLSLSVIRKAGEIEELARNVKGRKNLSVGANGEMQKE
jgi:hypothetical protein